jgi:hypothetical protein
MNTRELALNMLSSLGITALARWMLVSGGRFALNFHGVSSRHYSGIRQDLQPYHSVAEFRQVLDWLVQRFTFSQWKIPDNIEPIACCLPSMMGTNNLTNILPILADFQAQGLFFVATQHLNDPRDWLSFTRQDTTWLGCRGVSADNFARDCYDGLSESQLAELGRVLAVIGAHTVSHPSLPPALPNRCMWN